MNNRKELLFMLLATHTLSFYTHFYNQSHVAAYKVMSNLVYKTFINDGISGVKRLLKSPKSSETYIDAIYKFLHSAQFDSFVLDSLNTKWERYIKAKESVGGIVWNRYKYYVVKEHCLYYKKILNVFVEKGLNGLRKKRIITSSYVNMNNMSLLSEVFESVALRKKRAIEKKSILYIYTNIINRFFNDSSLREPNKLSKA